MKFVKDLNILIGIAGLLAAIVFAVCWYTAAVSDTTWMFGTNYLSDLGVSDYRNAELFFNAGCLITGVLFVLFGAGLLISKKDELTTAAGVVAVISGICVSLIGIVTEDAGAAHSYIAYAAFGLGFVCLIILALKDCKDGLKILSAITFAGFAVTALSPLFLEFPGTETVAALALLVLFLLQGAKFLYHGTVEKREADATGICDRHRLAFGFTAILASVTFLMFFAFSALSDTSWVFGTDPVYMLGASSVRDAQLFISIGCLVGGLLTAIYGIGAGLMTNRCPRPTAGAFAALAGITFCLAGISFLAYCGVSGYVEYLAMTFGAVAVLLVIASDMMEKRVVAASLYLVILISLAMSALISGYGYVSAFGVVTLFIVLLAQGIRLITE
jgi:hypothetical protein